MTSQPLQTCTNMGGLCIAPVYKFLRVFQMPFIALVALLLKQQLLNTNTKTTNTMTTTTTVTSTPTHR